MSMSIIVSHLQNFMVYRNTVIEDSSSIFHKIASAAHYDKISGKLSISKGVIHSAYKLALPDRLCRFVALNTYSIAFVNISLIKYPTALDWRWLPNYNVAQEHSVIKFKMEFHGGWNYCA